MHENSECCRLQAAEKNGQTAAFDYIIAIFIDCFATKLQQKEEKDEHAGGSLLRMITLQNLIILACQRQAQGESAACARLAGSGYFSVVSRDNGLGNAQA